MDLYNLYRTWTRIIWLDSGVVVGYILISTIVNRMVERPLTYHYT